MGDAGLFGPNSLTWQMHKEPTVLPMVLRTLLMEELQPETVTGTTDGRPWSNLQRAIEHQLTIDFGSGEAARSAVEAIRLSPWAAACAIDSAIVFYQLTVRPLTDWQQNRYVTERQSVLEHLGLDQPFSDHPGMRAFLADRFRSGRLSPSERGRGAAALLCGAGVPARWRPVWPLVNLAVAGSLPPEVRGVYDIPWDGRRARFLASGARWVKRLRPIVPGRVRVLRAAREAEERLADRS